jgi:putative hydrolase of the HAD superfamily
MAEAVSAALGVALRGEDLACHASEAAAAMERRGGTDAERAYVYLETLFRLGGIPEERLDDVRRCLARLHRERHLWSSVEDKTSESLQRLRKAGLQLAVVSNSDGRVEEALEAAGLREYFDLVIDSAVAGFEKPDPRIFQAALDALGVSADEALYVGDLYEVDIVGARAAGIEAVLLTRSRPAPDRSCRTAGSISDLVNTLLLQET